MIYDFFALEYDVASAAATIHRKPAGLESEVTPSPYLVVMLSRQYILMLEEVLVIHS
jgi:hypothetical protein